MGRKRRDERSSRPRKGEASAPREAPAPAAAEGFPWTWGLALAVLAFAVRATVAAQLGQTALFQQPQLDSFEFLAWAQSIARGELYRWLAATHGPGYPYFLGTLLSLLGGSVQAARMAQAALGAGLCVLTAALATRVFDRRAGLAAGILLALYGPLVYVEVSLLAEGLFLFLLTLALYLLVRPGYTVPRAAAAGALLGLAAVVRATALPLMPAFAALILLWPPSRSGGWPRKAAAWMALAWIAVVGPILLLVRQSSGGWLPLQAYGGLNFYMGNRIGANGTPTARLGGDWDLLHGEPDRQGITNPAERERYYTRKAWTEIGKQPLGFLAGLGRKAVWLVQDEEIRETHSLYFFREHSWLLRWLPGFGLLFPLAAWGIWLAASRRAFPPILLAYLLMIAASCVIIIMSSRYRLPLVPVLAVFAGGAAVWLVEAFRARDWRRLAPAAATLCLAFLASQVHRHEPSHNLAEEWTLTAASLQTLGRPDEARTAVDRALAEDPNSALALVQRARIRSEDGDLQGSEEALAAAVRVSPNYQRARYHYGLALKRRGDLDGAARELREALRLAPDDPRTRAELSEVLVEKARLEGAARRPAQGAELAAEAARLQPANPEAWTMAAMLALDAGNAALAEEALGRAQSLVGDAPALGLGWALLERLKGNPAGADARLRDVLRRNPGFQQAAQLFVANATEMGRRDEAISFLQTLR